MKSNLSVLFQEKSFVERSSGPAEIFNIKPALQRWSHGSFLDVDQLLLAMNVVDSKEPFESVYG